VLAAKQGGPREREQLIEAFRPSIVGVARMYRNSSRVEWNELLQEGVVGLLRALERVQGRAGDSVLGVRHVVGAPGDAAVSELSRPLVLSDRALRQLARVKKAQRALEQSEGRTATCQDLAQAVGLPRSQVESLIFAAADKHEAHKELGVLEMRLLRETMWSAPRSCWSMCGIRTSIR
jgi:RNA polymerase primary sigma factor